MKWNRTLRIFARCLLLLGIAALPLSLSGCGAPSQITVTGIEDLPYGSSGKLSQSESSEQVLRVSEPSSRDDTEDGRSVLSEKPSEEQTAEEIAVYVCGAVSHPGVVQLKRGARVCDALTEAGGFTDSADSQWLNQARMLDDGEMVIVYTKEETASFKEQGMTPGGSVPEAGPDPGGGARTNSSAAGGEQTLINLNTASKEQLMTLPGIGEAKADAIVRYRTESGRFVSPEDVMNISGIKNSIFEKIRDRITV